jgi:hypothetical protein
MNDQNDAEDTDAAVTVAIPVTTESATEATKQEDDEKWELIRVCLVNLFFTLRQIWFQSSLSLWFFKKRILVNSIGLLFVPNITIGPVVLQASTSPLPADAASSREIGAAKKLCSLAQRLSAWHIAKGFARHRTSAFGATAEMADAR